MSTGYSIYKKIQQEQYTIERKKFDGRDYIVAPVVMMVEGVHAGSHGPLLHTMEELGKFPESWNGIPIVIYHPEIDGNLVSANMPEVIEKELVGRVFNTRADASRLVAQVWLEEERLKAISQDVLTNLEAGKPLEVSLGMFIEAEMMKGTWNGEHFDAVAKNLRPDHLALLPGDVGACSLKDGCGIRVNSSGAMESINFISTGVTEPVSWTSTAVSTNALYDDGYVYWPLTTTVIINSNKKEENQMADVAGCTPCVKARVDQLIANGRFTEDDRGMLETLNEALLDKIATPIEVEKVVEHTIEVNALSDEDKALLATYKSQLKEKRNAVIKTIQDNFGKDKWPDEVLADMKDTVLDNLAALVKRGTEEDVDYSLNGYSGLETNASGDEEPLPPTGVTFK